MTISSDADKGNYATLNIMAGQDNIDDYLSSLDGISVAYKEYSFGQNDTIDSSFTDVQDMAQIACGSANLQIEKISVSVNGEITSDNDNDYAFVQFVEGEEENSVSFQDCEFLNPAVLYSKKPLDIVMDNNKFEQINTMKYVVQAIPDDDQAVVSFEFTENSISSQSADDESDFTSPFFEL